LLVRCAARGKRVAGIQAFVVEVEAESAMPFVGAWLREDFDSTPTWKLILRRKRIVVDANFANRFFGWNLTVRESVDFYLRLFAALRIDGTSHGLQRREKCLWIVRQCFEVASAQDDGVRVVVGISADVAIIDRDLLLFERYFELRGIRARAR